MIPQMSKFKFTVITAVNTLFASLLKNKRFATLDFSHLILALGGGMAIQSSVAEKWQAMTGVPILEAYGLTETSPCAVINPCDLKKYNATIGLPVSSTDIIILDEDHQEVEIGEPGELAIKGPQVMRGYWQNPEETEKVFTKDGWLLTGDIAAIDKNGYVKILERKKDMIIVSGFNVYPNEIEDVLVSMPGIQEAAVIAVPNENSGEVPKAFIVRSNPDLTAEDVIKFARTKLTGYKIPKHIKFVEELPKSNVGKVLRRKLRTNEDSL
jgi:long-chain acyl-CoA synthetase